MNIAIVNQLMITENNNVRMIENKFHRILILISYGISFMLFGSLTFCSCPTMPIDNTRQII